MSCVQYLKYIMMYLMSYVSCVKVTIFKATHRKCNEYGALPTPHLLVTFTQFCSSVCLTKIANMWSSNSIHFVCAQNKTMYLYLFLPRICIFILIQRYTFIIYLCFKQYIVICSLYSYWHCISWLRSVLICTATYYYWYWYSHLADQNTLL